MQAPEFKSDIPAHLLKGANPREKYVTETLSKLEQAVSWQTEQTVRIDDRVTNGEGKLKKFKEYAQPLLVGFEAHKQVRSMTRTRWALIIAAVTVLSSVCGACASVLSAMIP